MIDAKTKKTIREGVVCDTIKFKANGTIEFKSGYFYRCGRTAEGFGQRVIDELEQLGLKPTLIKFNDSWNAWPKDSYFIAEVRL